MPNNRPNSLSQMSLSRYAAVRQVLGITKMASQRDEEGRPVPAKVYPSPTEGQGWVVEAPTAGTPTEAGLTTFTGATALPQALEYAHRVYGSASYFCR